jgi:predicted dehydrogenase
MERTLQVGIVGFGMSAQVFHAPFIAHMPGYQLRAVVERRTNHAAEKYPWVLTYRSLDDMLADDAIDVVVITTPNETHFPFAQAALVAGKHVVLEKPFTNTTEEARQLVELAASSRGLLSVYQNRRYVSDFRCIVQLLQQGLLGTVHEYECHFDRYRPDAKPNAWREAPTAGSGILYDLGSHLIDQALCLFGLPQYITADIRQQRPHAQTDDYFDLRMDAGPVRIILRSGMLVREMGPRYMVHGTIGSYIKHGDDVQEAKLKAGAIPTGPDWGVEPADAAGLLHTEINGEVIRKAWPSPAGNFGDYYRHLYASIVHGAPLRETPAHGYNTIRLIELAFESSRQRRTLPVTDLMATPYPFGLPV